MSVVLPFRYGLNKNEQRKEKIVVSFTSYPERFQFVPKVFKTICWQSMRPDKIILYLCKSECKDGLPKPIRDLSKYGLEIEMVEDNLKPHKKYYYSMQKYPNDIVITIDDDILYPHNMIKELYASYLRYPDCISAARVHLMTRDKVGKLKNYNEWLWEYKKYKTPKHCLFATDGAGVLFPPHILIRETFDKENIFALCLNADDIWLKFMEIKGDKRVVYVPKANPKLCVIKKSQKDGLNKTNVFENANDTYIKKVMEYYQISDDIIWK